MTCCSASLPPGLLATSAFASQPLPGRLRRSGSRQKLLPTFTSVPILPRAPRHTSGSGGGTPHWGGTPVAGSLLMAAASVQLTEEDRALLDALDAPARGAGAAQQQQQRAAAMPGGTSFTSHTLPLAANCSGEAAVAPPGLPQAESLEHALHLAAAAAMGGDSLLLRSSAGAERPADQAVSAGGSSTGAPRRASTGRPEGLARWDSQGLAAAEGQHSLPQRAVRGSCASAFPGGEPWQYGCRACCCPPSPRVLLLRLLEFALPWTCRPACSSQAAASSCTALNHRPAACQTFLHA